MKRQEYEIVSSGNRNKVESYLSRDGKMDALERERLLKSGNYSFLLSVLISPLRICF